MQDFDGGRARKPTREFVGPLDRKDSVSRYFVQAEVIDFPGIREAIEIDMDEGNAATAIFLHDREGRTVHGRLVEPEAFGKSPRKRCFSCAEIPDQ